MKKLLVVWKSENSIDIEKFIIPYTYNSKVQDWFDHVELLIWGASQQLVKDNPEYHKYVKTLIQNGVEVYACKMCADSVGASEVFETLGIHVEYTGVYLSDKMKASEWEVITL